MSHSIKSQIRNFTRSIIIFVPLWAAASNASAVPLTASVDQGEGLPGLSLGGASAMSSQFIFWGKNWTWAQLKTQFKVVGPFEYAISGIDQPLKLALSARITKPSNRQLVWEFNLDAAANMPDVIGGGIGFKFDLASFGSQFGEPEILSGNSGWSWGRAGGTQAEMRFDPPLAEVY